METYQQLIARVNASAFLVNEADAPKAKRVRKRKLSKVARDTIAMAEKVGRAQIELMLEVLDPRNTLVTVRGEKMVVKPQSDGTIVVRSERTTHTVIGGECSCEDHRFRGSFCKHLEAVQAVKP